MQDTIETHEPPTVEALQHKIETLKITLSRMKLELDDVRGRAMAGRVEQEAQRASAWQEGWEAGVEAGIAWVTEDAPLPLAEDAPPAAPREAGLAMNPHVDGLLKANGKLRRQLDDAWDEVRKGNLPVDQIPAARAWVALAHEAMSLTGFVANDEPVTEPDTREEAVRMTEEEVRAIHKAFRAYMGRDKKVSPDELIDGLAKYSGVSAEEGLESAKGDVHWVVRRLLEGAVESGAIQPEEVDRMAFMYVSMLRMLAQTFWAASAVEGSAAPNYLLTTFVDPDKHDEVFEVVLRRVHSGQLEFVKMHRACVAMFAGAAR